MCAIAASDKKILVYQGRVHGWLGGFFGHFDLRPPCVKTGLGRLGHFGVDAPGLLAFLQGFNGSCWSTWPYRVTVGLT